MDFASLRRGRSPYPLSDCQSSRVPLVMRHLVVVKINIIGRYLAIPASAALQYRLPSVVSVSYGNFILQLRHAALAFKRLSSSAIFVTRTY